MSTHLWPNPAVNSDAPVHIFCFAHAAGGAPVTQSVRRRNERIVVVILETPRLELRHLELRDLDALFRLYRDAEIRRYFPDGTRTLEETKQELEWFRHGHPKFPRLGLWATVERSSGEFLGRCGLLPWDIEGSHEVELAFLIDKTRWGEGFATEAAFAIIDYAHSQLGLRRLICLITPGNVASVRVAAKVGMSFECAHEDELGLCHIYACSLA